MRSIDRIVSVVPDRQVGKIFRPWPLTFFEKELLWLGNGRTDVRPFSQAAMTPGPSGWSVEAGRT
jgi:hypothetical protein